MLDYPSSQNTRDLPMSEYRKNEMEYSFGGLRGKGMKKFKVHTLGCKVNQYDSQTIRDKLSYAGFNEIRSKDIADICVINTCTVTSRADTKSLYLIRKAIKDNPNAKIVVTGCAVFDNSKWLERIKGINLIVDNDRRDKIIKLIDPSLPDPEKAIPISNFNHRTRAFVKIQDGCDNFCSYCKVPYVRGGSRSRQAKDIKQEVKGLVDNGFKEIVLCGICLGDFGRGLSTRMNLVGLIEELEKIGGLKRIRLSSIEAKDVTDTLIAKISSSNKLCKHLHIPFQSGDDKILQLMNRKYTQNFYIKLIDKIKKAIKDVAITTDVIVGFPGESDENFDNTVKLLKKVLPLRTHVFPFSARAGTKAYSLQNKVPSSIIKERAFILKDAAGNLSYLYRQNFLHKRLDVLVEGNVDKKWDSYQGYSSNYIKVFIENKKLTGKNLNRVISVQVVKTDSENTWAEPLNIKADSRQFI